MGRSSLWKKSTWNSINYGQSKQHENAVWIMQKIARFTSSIQNRSSKRKTYKINNETREKNKSQNSGTYLCSQHCLRNSDSAVCRPILKKCNRFRIWCASLNPKWMTFLFPNVYQFFCSFVCVFAYNLVYFWACIETEWEKPTKRIIFNTY